MTKSLLAKMESLYPSLSKGHKRIASFIQEHYDKAAFMTASRLGETVGVSESTVVRFATEMGFDGYPELQKALQEMIRSKLTSVQRMEVTSSRMGEDDILEKVLTSDVEMIRATLEQTSRTDFRNAVNAINAARKIYILGVRSSAALASFMAFYFNLVYDNVVLVDTASEAKFLSRCSASTSAMCASPSAFRVIRSRRSTLCVLSATAAQRSFRLRTAHIPRSPRLQSIFWSRAAIWHPLSILWLRP